MTQRKRYSAEFKARMAFEAHKGEKTLNELASEYGVHLTYIARWKKHLESEGPRLFAARLGKQEQASGFIYVVAVLDWFSRYVVSWAVSLTLEVGFCVEALERVLEGAQPEIFNNDQGTQFTSLDCTRRLEAAGIQVSMDGRGRALDNIFDLTYERGYIPKNPHSWITLQKERRPDIDPLSFEEWAIFLQALPERWQPYFIVAFDTGIRPSEQMALHWRHADFTAKRLLIRRVVVRGTITDLKADGSWRDVDMLPTVEEGLRNLPDKRGYVFPNTEGGFLDLTNLRNRVWYPILKAAGLRP
jgi:integrase